MTRKTFAEVRAEQRAQDIDEVCEKLISMGLREEAKKMRLSMTGECWKVWPYIDETRYTLNG